MFAVFSKLLRSRSSQVRRGKAASRRPVRRTFEILEGRRMMDANCYVEGSTLHIDGTQNNDEVVVYYDAGLVVVRSSSDFESGFAFSRFANTLSAIEFRGFDGKDRFENATGLSLTAYGGRGNDVINVGGSYYSVVYGEQDDDILIGNNLVNRFDGGVGNDTLMGLGGADVMFGGAGSDELWGGDGRDFMDGGFDYTLDKVFGNLADGVSDNDRDFFVFEYDGANVSDVNVDFDVAIAESEGDDFEGVYRATGKLPDSIGTSSSGYEIGAGITFEFAARDFDFSAIDMDWQNWISPTEEYYSNWTSDSLDQFDDLDLLFSTSYLPPMLVTDPDLAEEPSPGATEEDSLIVPEVVDDYFSDPAEEGDLLDADEALEGPAYGSDDAFDSFYEELATSPLTPLGPYYGGTTVTPSTPFSTYRTRLW
jgi:hypothetical protein